MKRIYVLIYLLLLTFSCSQPIGNKNFESVKWKKGDKYVRGTMINYLLKSKLALKKTKLELLNIFGTPNDSANNTYSYVINLSHIDNRDDLDCWLTIKFEEGRSQKVWVND
jgi:hypothetical protein